MTLWPHQDLLVNQAREAYRQGARRILCVLPCGGGKTRTAASMVANSVSKGHRVLWIAHLEELLDQARSVLPAEVDVASIQSLRRSPPSGYDVVVVDEAHHTPARTYRETLKSLAPRLVIGLTATPSRLDGQPLGEHYDAICVGATTSELIRSGVLVPTRVLGSDPRRGILAAHPVDAYTRHCPGAKALVFAASVSMAQELAREFAMAGYPAASLDGKVRKEARRDINERFRSGELRVLTNARLISEGYDVPDVDTVIIASNMTSPAMLLQAVGRGKRSSVGKQEELVLDLAGVCISLGMHPDDDLKYSLEGIPIRTEKDRGDKISRCAECLGVFWANEFIDSTCPRCGFVRPGRPDPRVVAAELEELKRGRAAKNPDVSLLSEILDQAVSDKQARFLFNRRRGYWPSNALLERAKT